MSTQINNFKKHFFKFIDNLKKTFPEYTSTIDKHYTESWGSLDDINTFYNKLTPYSEYISTSNDKLFYDHTELYFLNEINFVLLWRDKKLTDRSKEYLWKHLHTLLIIGNLINGIDIDNLLKSIDLNKQDNNDNTSSSSSNSVMNDESQINDAKESVKQMFNSNNSANNNFIGGMVEDIAGELSQEFNKNPNFLNPQALISGLLGNNNNNPLMNIVKNVSDKIETRVKDGNIDEKELLSSAQGLFNQMNMPGMPQGMPGMPQGMPGMPNMQDLQNMPGMHDLTGMPGMSGMPNIPEMPNVENSESNSQNSNPSKKKRKKNRRKK